MASTRASLPTATATASAPTFVSMPLGVVLCCVVLSRSHCDSFQTHDCFFFLFSLVLPCILFSLSLQNLCMQVRTCGDDEWEAQAPTSTTNRICAPCTSCPAHHAEVEPCTATSNRGMSHNTHPCADAVTLHSRACIGASIHFASVVDHPVCFCFSAQFACNAQFATQGFISPFPVTMSKMEVCLSA